MMLYTITPIEELFPEWFGGEQQFIEIDRGPLHMQVEQFNGVQGRIVRLFSTDPQDYLQPAYQPGMLVNLTAAEALGRPGPQE